MSATSAHPYRRAILVAGLSLLAAATIVACEPPVGSAAAAGPVAAPPAPPVTVDTVQQRTIEPHAAQVGRVEAAQRVEIRPRVAGPIDAVLFREGETVRAGQPLFRIDPRPFDVALERARAELQLARARETLAASEAERARRLAAEHAIATEELERRAATHAEAQARSAAAQAAVQAAQLDREFTTVTAPVAGRIGRALVVAGNYVAAGNAQSPLATLSAVSPVHVHFDLGDPSLIAQLAAARQPTRWQARILDPQTGAAITTAPVDFVDHEVAQQAGTLRLRARIDTPTPNLLSGQYVRVQLVGASQPALLVPERAIATDQGKRFVLVVGPGQVAEYRPVQLGALHGEHRVVTAGVKQGEQVIVSGLMRARPGMKVQPQPASGPTDAAAASAPAKS